MFDLEIRKRKISGVIIPDPDRRIRGEIK